MRYMVIEHFTKGRPGERNKRPPRLETASLLVLRLLSAGANRFRRQQQVFEELAVVHHRLA